jgi:cell division protein ZipA
MDKDLLRIVIIMIGVIVIMGMLIWHFLRYRKDQEGIDFYDKGDPLDNIDDSLVVNTENDDFDIVPLGSVLGDDLAPDPITVASESNQQHAQKNDAELPEIVQFSIVASADEGFNGQELAETFKLIGLEYGSVKVFERLDENRHVNYAVASMVEPGTFPETSLESFFCPGIVFFLQPGDMENPIEIFDEFVQTIKLLASELDGVIWDHNRQPLTEDVIQHFRENLMRV